MVCKVTIAQYIEWLLSGGSVENENSIGEVGEIFMNIYTSRQRAQRTKVSEKLPLSYLENVSKQEATSQQAFT